jgi:predicted nucleic acid-binding protein
MVVVDTSAFVSLGVGDVLSPITREFDLGTTKTTVAELEETAEYDDRHGRAAAVALDLVSEMTVVDSTDESLVTSRIDAGEASCVAAIRNHGGAFLVTDDFRALPELQTLVDADVALSPILLRASVGRGVLTEAEARTVLQTIADERDWLGAPIYRYAQQLFASSGDTNAVRRSPEKQKDD